MTLPNSAGGPAPNPPSLKNPIMKRKGPTIRPNLSNPISQSNEPRTPSSSSVSPNAPTVKVMVPMAFAQDAKNQFLVSQGIQNRMTSEPNPEIMGGWQLDTYLRDNFIPLPAPYKPLPFKPQNSDDILVEVIFCGESPPIPETVWQKHTK